MTALLPKLKPGEWRQWYQAVYRNPGAAWVRSAACQNTRHEAERDADALQQAFPMADVRVEEVHHA